MQQMDFHEFRHMQRGGSRPPEKAQNIGFPLFAMFALALLFSAWLVLGILKFFTN